MYIDLISKRDAYVVDDNWGSSSWQWGRWILFVIFVVFLIVIFFGTFRVNKRRRILGQAPIRGTAWMTPPSYRQSERDYNANGSGRNGTDYVPKYTAEANDEDLGFYDERGEFHPNAKSEYLPPPPLVHEVNSTTSSTNYERPDLPPPHSGVQSSEQNLGNVAVVDDASIDDMDFRRYNYIGTDNTNNTMSNQEDVQRPSKAA